jgi:hypothetical protein
MLLAKSTPDLMQRLPCLPTTSGSSTYWIEYTQLAPSENRSPKSADGRVATEAAWLNGNNLENEKMKKKKEKNQRNAWRSPAFSWKDLSAKK